MRYRGIGTEKINRYQTGKHPHTDEAPEILAENDHRKEELQTQSPQNHPPRNLPPVVGHGPGETEERHHTENADKPHRASRGDTLHRPTVIIGQSTVRSAGVLMAMDFETVKFLRYLFAVVFASIGGAMGVQYYDKTGAIAGVVIGALVGWNLVDLFKGRAHK